MRDARGVITPGGARRIILPAIAGLLLLVAAVSAPIADPASPAFPASGTSPASPAPPASPTAAGWGSAGGHAEAAPSLLPGGGLMGLKLLISLVVVIGLILVLQRFARRWGGAFTGGARADQIRLLSQRAVGPRLSLAVVEVMGRTLLVGISPQGIRPVADLGRPESPLMPDPADTAGPPAYDLGPGSSRETSGSRGLLASLIRRPSGRRLQRSAAPETPSTTPPPTRSQGPEAPEEPQAAPPLNPLFSDAPPATPPTTSPSAQNPQTPEEPPAEKAFEGELTRRLASLRKRYPSLADLEAGRA